MPSDNLGLVGVPKRGDPLMQHAKVLLATAERYRAMAGTITDQDIAHRLIEYANELAGRAEHLRRHGEPVRDGRNDP
jgi:hypothetical protein